MFSIRNLARLYLFIVLVYIYSGLGVAQAAPAITGISTTDSVTTIVGTGFGTLGMPELYDNFNTCVDDVVIQGTDPLIGPEWRADFLTGGANGSQCASGTAQEVFLASANIYTAGFNYRNASTFSKFFVAWDMKIDMDEAMGSSFNSKIIEAYSSGGSGRNSFYVSHNNTSMITQAVGAGASDFDNGCSYGAPCEQIVYPYGGTSSVNIATDHEGEWVRREGFYELNTANVRNGNLEENISFIGSTDDTWEDKFLDDAYYPKYSGYEGTGETGPTDGYGYRGDLYATEDWQDVTFNSYHRVNDSEGGNDATISLDNVYINEGSYSHVTECDTGTSIAERTDCITIVPTAWSATSISVPEVVAGRAVYITDDAGVVSAFAAISGTPDGTNVPPVISGYSSMPWATYVGQDMVFSVNAADSDGTIASVEIFIGTTSIGTATHQGGSLYTLSYTTDTAADSFFNVTVTDNDGDEDTDKLLAILRTTY